MTPTFLALHFIRSVHSDPELMADPENTRETIASIIDAVVSLGIDEFVDKALSEMEDEDSDDVATRAQMNVAEWILWLHAVSSFGDREENDRSRDHLAETLSWFIYRTRTAY